ncbi:FAD/NAD(P)-binding protein [Haloferacaceae archaeon DSL9]
MVLASDAIAFHNRYSRIEAAPFDTVAAPLDASVGDRSRRSHGGSPVNSPPTDLVIVGGGVHGAHIAVALLDAGVVDRSGLRIVEPRGRLLSGFEEKCRQCGMRELRSPFVHHIGTDPFSLRDFAQARDRTDEIRPSAVGGDRPSLELFFDHARWAIDRHDLTECVVPARATTVRRRSGGLVVETTDGPLRSDFCVLAVGYGGQRNRPTWAAALPDDAPATHVWADDFDVDAVPEGESVGVVGGGITAAQLATTLAQPDRDVALFARRPFRVESLEADSAWMHFGGIEAELHDLPPGSDARRDRVREARNDGTVPPHVFRRLRRALSRGDLTLRSTEITGAVYADGPVVVECDDGTAWCLDRLVFATGFGDPYAAPLLCEVRRSLGLATGDGRMPILDDRSLVWRRRDGTPSRIALSGVAAESVLGPFARNVIGARRAGALLVDWLTADRPTQPTVIHA